MYVLEQILKKKQYKAQIDELTDETLQIVVENHIKALEYAHKGIQQVEPVKQNDLEYLEAVADGIQKLARMVLEQRAKIMSNKQ